MNLTLIAYESYKFWCKVWDIVPLDYESWQKLSDLGRTNMRSKSLPVAYLERM